MTPCRVVLGLLPALDLQLPGDPPGMRHPVSCLLEAVPPAPAPAVLPPRQPDAAPSPAWLRLTVFASGERRVLAALLAVRRSFRLWPLLPATPPLPCLPTRRHRACPARTRSRPAAGAVACWHEAAAEPAPPILLAPDTRAPAWRPGPGGFTVHFPAGPMCPQLELFSGALALSGSCRLMVAVGRLRLLAVQLPGWGHLWSVQG